MRILQVQNYYFLAYFPLKIKNFIVFYEKNHLFLCSFQKTLYLCTR